MQFFHLQNFYQVLRPTPINMQKYETILGLLLLSIQSLKSTFGEQWRTKDCFLNNLQMIPVIENNTDEKLLIQCSQMELMKMLFNEMTRKEILLDNHSNSLLQEGLNNLIINNQTDLIQYFYRQNSYMQILLTQLDHCRKLISIIIGTRSRRQIFQRFLDDKSLELWLTSTTLLFILLKKKKCK